MLHPLSASLYSQPPNRWGPVDIWTANGPFYRTLRTLVVHPAMIYQMKGSNKGEGSEPVFSARWAGRSLRNEDEGEEKAQEAKEMWEVVHKEWGGKLGMGKA